MHVVAGPAWPVDGEQARMAAASVLFQQVERPAAALVEALPARRTAHGEDAGHPQRRRQKIAVGGPRQHGGDAGIVVDQHRRHLMGMEDGVEIRPTCRAQGGARILSYDDATAHTPEEDDQGEKPTGDVLQVEGHDGLSTRPQTLDLDPALRA